MKLPLLITFSIDVDSIKVMVHFLSANLLLVRLCPFVPSGAPKNTVPSQAWQASVDGYRGAEGREPGSSTMTLLPELAHQNRCHILALACLSQT